MDLSTYRVAFLLGTLLAAVCCVGGQTKSCDLEVRAYSYDAIESPKNRITGVSVTLTELKSGNHTALNSDGSLFNDVEEGKYELQFEKVGFKTRKKHFALDCKVANQDNVVFDKTYLWAGDKSAVGGLVADAPRDNDDKPRGSKVTGEVSVRLTIDEDGNVQSATAIDGKDVLRPEAVLLARRAKFAPTFDHGSPVKVTGNIKYKFVP